MERKVGERFDYKGKTLKVIESEKDFCCGCYFRGWCCIYSKEVTGFCSRRSRTDYKDVIFKEIEK